MKLRKPARPCLTPASGKRARASVLAAAVLLCFGVPATASAQGDAVPYRLGPEDEIRLKVYEWRPSQDEIFEWKALNDKFIVSASGMLSIPLAGDIPVQDLSLDDVAHAIAERLRQRMNLTAPPDAAVDIVQYRPFYVSGDVAHPGPFPYHPGLTVLNAVAIAGGSPRTGDLGLLRMGRDVITGEGEFDQLVQEHDALLIRRARLQAEVKGEASFTLPVELESSSGRPEDVRLMQNEQRILQARQQSFKTQSDALQELKTFLNKETETLSAQLATIDTQMQLNNKELAGITSLVEKGMVIAPRQLALERSAAQIQGDRLSMDTNRLRVQEEISKTEIALIQLRDNRVTDASIELRDTQVKLDDIATKMLTNRKLVFEARVTAPGLVADHRRRGAALPTYVLVPRGGSQADERVVSDGAAVQPGDTVKVTLPDVYDDGDPSGAAASLSRPGALQ